jgi:hypothetical protein
MAAVFSSDLSVLAILVCRVNIMERNFRKQFYISCKLQRNLHTKHVYCKDKPIAYLKNKYCDTQLSETNLTPVIFYENGNVWEVSYKVNPRLALLGEANIFAENLIVPCLGDIVSCVFYGNTLKFIQKFHFPILKFREELRLGTVIRNSS